MRRICLIIVVLLFLALLLPTAVCAEEQSEITFDEVLSSLIDALDGDEASENIDEYWQRLGLEGETFKDKLLNVINGNFSVNYGDITSALLSLVFNGILSLLPILLSVCAIAVLYSIVKTLSPDVISDGVCKVLHFACYAAILGLLAYKTLDIVNSCYKNVKHYAGQMEIVFPMILTVMTATGSTVSASVYQPAVAFLSNGIIGIITSVVMPLSVFLILLSSVSGLSSNLKTVKLEGFISSIIKWILGISITVFTMFLSVQGMTAGTYDGITLRVTKYAIGNSVPIVGGFLRDGVDLFLAAGLLIKNALGIFGIVFIVGIFLSPLVELVAFMLLLKLAAGIIEPFADSAMAGYMYSISKNLNYVLAAVLMVCFMYVITIVLIICTGGAML